MKTVGDRIQEQLEKMNLTQKELAEKVNVQEATISRYVNNERQPRSDILSRIASILNVTSDYLLGTDERNSSYNIESKAKEILEVIKSVGIDLENIDYEKLEQLLKLSNIEKEKQK